jgi:ribosomal protein S18 acetylase RimI-like enzyme
MSDMLVKLYDLADDWAFMAQQAALGITIRKPIGAERGLVIDWVGQRFSDAWRSETEGALARRPFTCFIALKEQELVGFGCYDAIGLGFFGPLGVVEAHQRRGTGKALLLACLLDMKLKGYGYAIIGWVGPVEFYQRTVGAVEIPDSRPGYWRGWLRQE